MFTRAVVYCAWCALWKGCPRDAWRNGTRFVQWVHAQTTVETVTTVRARSSVGAVCGVTQRSLSKVTFGASDGHVHTCSSVLRLVCALERVSPGCMAQWDMSCAVGTRTNDSGDRHHRASQVERWCRGAAQTRLAHNVNAAQAADMSTRAVVYCAWCALWKGCPVMHGAMGHVLCSGYTHKQQWRPSPPCEPSGVAVCL